MLPDQSLHYDPMVGNEIQTLLQFQMRAAHAEPQWVTIRKVSMSQIQGTNGGGSVRGPTLSGSLAGPQFFNMSLMKILPVQGKYLSIL